MRWDQFEGEWAQLQDQVKEKWGKLTSEDIIAVQGKKEQLLGKLQKRYGYRPDRADRELRAFVRDFSCASTSQLKTNKQPSI